MPVLPWCAPESYAQMGHTCQSLRKICSFVQACTTGGLTRACCSKEACRDGIWRFARHGDPFWHYGTNSAHGQSWSGSFFSAEMQRLCCGQHRVEWDEVAQGVHCQLICSPFGGIDGYACHRAGAHGQLRPTTLSEFVTANPRLTSSTEISVQQAQTLWNLPTAILATAY